MLNVLFIDNFDSFTFNLVDEFEKIGCNVIVYRNNTSLDKIRDIVTAQNIRLIVISPGGYVPKEVPVCKEIIRKYHQTIPIFGVCLGHECIIEALGGKIENAPLPVHGKNSKITHDNKTIFKNIINPFYGGRYHSQIGKIIPDCLEVSAKTENIVMAVRHKKYFVEGVQFHPESILTPQGSLIIKNLVEQVKK
ncbi:MAG: aminodeoxychorismate/anthranilate synthase component II [Nanoarchaeota archaeon]|nr:aminodeoxychorismate/anthranilate synthase component II [Nanoarchaeota archaeon]